MTSTVDRGATGASDGLPDALLRVRDLRVSYPGRGRRAPRAEIPKGGLPRHRAGRDARSGGRVRFGQDDDRPGRPRAGPRAVGLARIAELLDRVRLPADAADRLPREFSGGQRQRVAIARALALLPRLVICDEPVSALDLTTRRTVLEPLLEIQEESGVAHLFVTHDLTVVRFMSHRVAVIRGGELVESGDARSVTSEPRHPYTRALMLGAPVADVTEQRRRREAAAQGAAPA
nr:ABC transporter ATP-binding protein [Streptomyces globisporus]